MSSVHRGRETQRSCGLFRSIGDWYDQRGSAKIGKGFWWEGRLGMSMKRDSRSRKTWKRVFLNNLRTRMVSMLPVVVNR